MARLYESPTIERVGGDDLVQPQTLILAIYAVKIVVAINVAVAANVAAGVNMFAGYNWAWFWSKRKEKK